jgi:hydroxymethylpyrimidine/phosphomethylpyrimidine kinase
MMTGATLTFTNSQKALKKKLFARKRWKAALSKQSATTVTVRDIPARIPSAERKRVQRRRSSSDPGIIPVALTIAGSDCSAGAGIQADLKTFAALGVYGLTAVTCVVAEIPGKVSGIEALRPRIVRDQIEVLLRNFQVGAIKTGLLCSGDIVSAVAEALQGSRGRVPLVIDPVMIATTGDRLLEPEAIDAYKNQLFPLATLLTPNLDEASVLLGSQIRGRQQMERAATMLAEQFGCAVLLKGGHLQGDEAIDFLVQGGRSKEFSALFVRGVATHGTGCTYSAAITASLASGLSLDQAIRRAKKFVTKSIARHFRWKRPVGNIDALNHWL